MANCTSYSNLHGVKGEWTICWDIPKHTKEGIYYQYPGEPPNFIEGAERWECNPGTYNVYRIDVKTKNFTYCLDDSGKVFATASRELIVPCFILGEIQKPVFIPATFTIPGSSGDGAAFGGFGFGVYTDKGIFGANVQPIGGGVIANIEYVQKNGVGYSVNIDYNFPGGLGGGSCFSRTISVKLNSKVKVFDEFDSTADKTFKVFNKGNGKIFERVDQVCPNVWFMPEGCKYTGEYKSRKVPYNNQSNAYLQKNNYTDGSKKCVRVFKVGKIGRPAGITPSEYYNIGSPILLLDVCSPDDCDLAPDIKTSSSGAFKCPPGSCQMDCNGEICCYDDKGKLIGNFKDNKVNNPYGNQPDNPQDRQDYVALNYGDEPNGLTGINNDNYFLNFG